MILQGWTYGVIAFSIATGYNIHSFTLFSQMLSYRMAEYIAE
jgi:hypothetical protein